MSSPTVTEVLAEIATRPSMEWSALLHARFPDDPSLVSQALIWLAANAEQLVPRNEPPALGAAGERYELGLLLDTGATASVWQAFDRKLGRNVAIKVFRDEQSPALEEILSEARAASEVNSDHVVRVLDVHDAEPPYIVMELVGEHDPKTGVLDPGSSAASCRPLHVAEAVRWTRDVARGVHDAHLRNVFHRDLKPHNVLVAPHSRRAKIADFGIAVSAAHAVADATELVTPRGRIAGTPAYMAPEQARGLSAALDPHDPEDRKVLVGIDVWGVGALAFELCAGRPLWIGAGELEAWELAAAGAPPDPLDVTPDGEPIPRRLRRVIAKALAPDRADRYANAAELADDLDAFLARKPTSLDKSRGARLVLWCRRNPQLAVTALLATVLASLTLVAYAAVREVRDQRNQLASEIERARVINEQLVERAELARGELAVTEDRLLRQTTALDELQRTLGRANLDYAEVVSATQRALRDADAATRELVTRLAAMREQRDAAQLVHKLSETFLARARTETDQAERELEQAVRERDAARAEREQFEEDRDAARLARMRAEAERDAARAERDHAEATRRRVETDLARLAAQLATLIANGNRTAQERAPAPVPDPEPALGARADPPD